MNSSRLGTESSYLHPWQPAQILACSKNAIWIQWISKEGWILGWKNEEIHILFKQKRCPSSLELRSQRHGLHVLQDLGHTWPLTCHFSLCPALPARKSWPWWWDGLGAAPGRCWSEKSNCCLTCWLSGSCLFQVVERFVIVPKVVEGHTGPVKGLEILPFFLQDFEAVLLDSLIVHQLSLEQAGYRGREQKGKAPSTQQQQPLNWLRDQIFRQAFWTKKKKKQPQTRNILLQTEWKVWEPGNGRKAIQIGKLPHQVPPATKAESQTCWRKQQATNPVGMGGMGVGGCGHREHGAAGMLGSIVPSWCHRHAPLSSLSHGVEAPLPPALPPRCWSLPWCSHSSADGEEFCQEPWTSLAAGYLCGTWLQPLPPGLKGFLSKTSLCPSHVLCSLLRVFFLSCPPFSDRHFCLLTWAVKTKDLCFF